MGLKHVLEFMSQSLHVVLAKVCTERWCKPLPVYCHLKTRDRCTHRCTPARSLPCRVYMHFTIGTADKAHE